MGRSPVDRGSLYNKIWQVYATMKKVELSMKKTTTLLALKFEKEHQQRCTEFYFIFFCTKKSEVKINEFNDVTQG